MKNFLTETMRNVSDVVMKTNPGVVSELDAVTEITNIVNATRQFDAIEDMCETIVGHFKTVEVNQYETHRMMWDVLPYETRERNIAEIVSSAFPFGVCAYTTTEIIDWMAKNDYHDAVDSVPYSSVFMGFSVGMRKTVFMEHLIPVLSTLVEITGCEYAKVITEVIRVMRDRYPVGDITFVMSNDALSLTVEFDRKAVVIATKLVDLISESKKVTR